MLVQIPDVLTSEQVAEGRRLLFEAEWADGRITAGHQSSRVKHNLQLPEHHPVAQQLGEVILGALQRNPHFMSAALPFRVFPPLFNRYEGGEQLRQSRGQRDPAGAGHAASHPHGSVGDAVLHQPRRVRRRRAADRGHLRRAQREAAGGPPGALPVDQPAQRAPGDARRARRVVLLAAEHDSRRRAADAAVRHGHGDSAHQPRRAGSSVGRAADGRVSQPAAGGGRNCS